MLVAVGVGEPLCHKLDAAGMLQAESYQICIYGHALWCAEELVNQWKGTEAMHWRAS